MTSIIVYMVCLVILFGSIHARSLYRGDVDIDPFGTEIPLRFRSKLRYYLQNLRDQSSIDSLESREVIPIIVPKRSSVVHVDPQSKINRRNRPSYTYGRKPHWDTFFG